MARMNKDKYTATTIDAERLKRNMAWTLKLKPLEEDCTYDDFKNAVQAVLNHHFNDHALCGNWCQAKNLTLVELSTKGLKYHDKLKDNNMYLMFKKVHDEFMKEENLIQLFHTQDTNIVEGMKKTF